MAAHEAPLQMNGQRATKNQRGFDMGKPSYRSEDWISSYNGQLPLLDVGCGLGTNTCVALKKGARVIAIDYEDSHLQIIREEAGEEALKSGQLQTKLGKLPNDVDLPPECTSGILCAQVIHFLDLDGVKQSLAHFYRWLAPGGKLVLLAGSHYVMFNLTSGNIRDIHWKMDRDGPDNPDSAPGLIDGAKFHELLEPLKMVLPATTLSSMNTQGPFQTFSNRQLASLARHAGFEVLEAELCSGQLSNYPQFLTHGVEALDDDLREYIDKDQVLVIAQKPMRSG